MAFFTSGGRLRRRTYWLRVSGLYAVGTVIYALPALLHGPDIPSQTKLFAFGGLVIIGYLVVVQALQRLHDLDLRAWWALALVLPVVSYILGGGLQLVQGTIGPNRFGPDPKRPHLVFLEENSPTGVGGKSAEQL